MEKTKNVICPNCGKIQEKKEYNFDYDVIQGNVKEWPLQIENQDINGLEFCAVCR